MFNFFTMPFHFFFKKDKSHNDPNSPTASMSSKEKKSLLGLKNMQSQQNPEPIYDLSYCDATELPNDTFMYCKILNKIHLNLKGNWLTSIESAGLIQDLPTLKILDLSYNRFEKLPSNISFIKNLTVLKASHNKLKCLPESISLLVNLEEVHLCSNKFSKVPLVLCALLKLKMLSLKDNNITVITKDITRLHRSLEVLELDDNKIESPSQEVIENGLTGVMNYFCEMEGIVYEGPVNFKEDVCDNLKQVCKEPITLPVDDIMVEYMKKKQQQLKAQISEEERMRFMESEQLASVLSNNCKSREKLLHELNSSPFEFNDYEEKKQEKIIDQMKLEKKFRVDQDEQIDQYLKNSNNKEMLLQDISLDQNNMEKEFQALVVAKDCEKQKLLTDICKVEQETDSALQEILNIQQSQKSQDFILLVQKNDEELQAILMGASEASIELRRSDVLNAMQYALLEVAAIEAQRDKVEEKQRSWISSLIKDGQIEESRIESLLNDRNSNQEAFVANVLQEEEYQAEAFKLLLLKMDLKRNSVIRQIAMVEQELIRLSSIELRKKQFGLRYGSSTILDKRRTLVDILRSLLHARDKRDDELNMWVGDLSAQRSDGLTNDDFWLLQYQRLMTMKPKGVELAELDLDDRVRRVLDLAAASHLTAAFGTAGITFEQLLDMTEEDFIPLGGGTATYHCIQRALREFLQNEKIGNGGAVPSAPAEEDDKGDASALASAPPMDASNAYVEAECVVCLERDCRVLFLPCGHVCVCVRCCKKLKECPLCRSHVEQKCFMDIK